MDTLRIEKNTLQSSDMACQAPPCRLDVMGKLNERPDQESCRLPELLSVSSYNSLSSLSSCESESDINVHPNTDFHETSGASHQRSIFRSYWDKAGSIPQSPIVAVDGKPRIRSDTTATTSSQSSVDSDSDISTSANSYERTLKRNEGIKSSRSSGRRSIFGNSTSTHQSMQSLTARPYHPSPLQRRAKSSSELEKGKLPSCLRSSEERRKIRSSSVSFDTEVSVYEFNPPKENWAADGWSTWFH